MPMEFPSRRDMDAQDDEPEAVSNWVNSITCATEEDWEYATPALDRAVSTVVISLDGTPLPIKSEQDRQTPARAVAR